MTEDEIAKMRFSALVSKLLTGLSTKLSIDIHQGHWCDGGNTIRSRKGSLADKLVQHKYWTTLK